MESARSDRKRLSGHRVLVVQGRSPTGLALGAAISRAGGQVTVARTCGAALVEIERRRQGFDAAVIDDALPPEGVANVVSALRTADRPCLVVGLASAQCGRAGRTVVRAGAVELLTAPYRDEDAVDAIAHVAAATRNLRSCLAGASTARDASPRRPPHWVRLSRRTSANAMGNGSDLDDRLETFARDSGLSQREASVLRYIAMGYRYAEIGAALSISARTVKMHASNVRRKAGVADRYQLLRRIHS